MLLSTHTVCVGVEVHRYLLHLLFACVSISRLFIGAPRTCLQQLALPLMMCLCCCENAQFSLYNELWCIFLFLLKWRALRGQQVAVLTVSLCSFSCDKLMSEWNYWPGLESIWVLLELNVTYCTHTHTFWLLEVKSTTVRKTVSGLSRSEFFIM